MPSPNTIVPRAAPAEFRHQQCRRELWLAKAQAKQATRKVKTQMKRLVAIRKRKLQGSYRRERREQIRNDPQARARSLVTNWEKYIREDQGTTRRAGHAWAVHCFNTDNWGPNPTPSRDDFTHLLAHFKSSLKWPQHKMSWASLQLLDYYNTLPLRPNSKELAKARIRMVREMMLLGVLDREKARGLKVLAREERKAKVGMLPKEEGGGWMMLEIPEDAIFWREKDIDWRDVESWVGVEAHELPLRKSVHLRDEQFIKGRVEIATPVIDEDDDDDDEEEEVSSASSHDDEGGDDDDEDHQEHAGGYEERQRRDDTEGLYEDDVDPIEIEDEDAEMN